MKIRKQFILLDPDVNGNQTGGSSTPNEQSVTQGAETMDDFDKAALAAIETVQNGTSPTPQGEAAKVLIADGGATNGDDKAKTGEQVTHLSTEGETEEARLAREKAEADAAAKVVSDGEKKKDGEPAKVTEENPDAKLPFNDHPRWKEVLAQRDTAQVEATKLKQSYEAALPLAQRQQEIETYLATNNVPVKDFQDAVQLLALSRSDPAKALELLTPFMQGLEAMAGRGIAPDLMAQVKDGTLQEAHAQEITKLRAQTAQRNIQQQQAVETQRQSVVAAQQQAVSSWFTNKKVLDPSFEAKVDLFNGQFAVECQTAPPTTPAQVVSLLEKAYLKTNERLSALQPKPPTRRAPLESQATRTTPTEPDNIDDFASQAIDRLMAGAK